MKNIFIKKKKEGGYAILFAVVIISSITVIAAGLTNAAYKQLVLSSLAKDSQVAFYQSDKASDCALYADIVFAQKPENAGFFEKEGTWTCGEQTLNIKPAPEVNGYNLVPEDQVLNSTNPCFNISVSKVLSAPDVYDTTIKAKGYNICDIDNPRVVEREIEVNY